MKQTIEELKRLQALPLETKIKMTEQRLMEWVNHYGLEHVFISFSGGKDSTVLLDIARRLYPEIKAVFVDVPTQFPELRNFVKAFDNVDIIKPKYSFLQVCEKYGFPLISKETSECVYGARRYLKSVIGGVKDNINTDLKSYQAIPSDIIDKIATSEHTNGGEIADYENYGELANFLSQNITTSTRRLAIITDTYLVDWNKHKKEGNIPSNATRSRYSQARYKFFLDAPFEISNACCNVMKKTPIHAYERKNNRKSITAQMASESRLRTQQWLMHGCNSFDNKNPLSNPMAFWVENDVLEYIVTKGVKICSVYGDVVEDFGKELDGQMCLADFGIGEKHPKYKCTGCQRTGCVLCGFGCHLEKQGQGRFENLKVTHPGMYKLLDVCKNNGVTYREAIEWTNKHGNLNIRL